MKENSKMQTLKKKLALFAAVSGCISLLSHALPSDQDETKRVEGGSNVHFNASRNEQNTNVPVRPTAPHSSSNSSSSFSSSISDKHLNQENKENQIEMKEPSKPKTLVYLAPSQETYRREVSQNPHGTPASLKNFAAVVATRFENAKNSPEQAEELFAELKDCAQSEEQLNFVRAFCVDVSQKIAVLHPTLNDELFELIQAMPSQVMALNQPLTATR